MVRCLAGCTLRLWMNTLTSTRRWIRPVTSLPVRAWSWKIQFRLTRCSVIRSQPGNRTYTLQPYIVPTYTLYLPIHCTYLYIVPTYTLYLPIHCTYLYIVPTHTLYLPIHCTYPYIVPTYTLYLPIHCTYLYIVPTYTLYLPIHCTHQHIVPSYTLKLLIAPLHSNDTSFCCTHTLYQSAAIILPLHSFIHCTNPFQPSIVSLHSNRRLYLYILVADCN